MNWICTVFYDVERLLVTYSESVKLYDGWGYL